MDELHAWLWAHEGVGVIGSDKGEAWDLASVLQLHGALTPPAGLLFCLQPGKPPVRIPDIYGESFLSTLGFDTDNTTIDIAILIAM